MQASSLAPGLPAGVNALASTSPATPPAGTTPSPTRVLGVLTPVVSATPATSLATALASVTPTPSSAQSLSFRADGTPLASTTATSAPSATGTPAMAAPLSSGTSAGGDTSELLRMLNEGRASLGLSQLRPNPTLTSAAANYARYMATANFFSHSGVDGSTPEGRVDSLGYAGNWRGETLAAGQATAGLAFDVWWNKSPPHRAILVDPGATEVGIGYYFDPSGTYGYYWVLELGTP